MKKNVNENMNGDFSELVKSEIKIVEKNIEILRSWRETLWDSVFKGTSAFFVSYLDDIFNVYEQLDNFRLYLPDEVWSNFVREYQMTMFLIQKCLIKSLNDNLVPASEEDQLKIKDLITKIEIMQQNYSDIDTIVMLLKKEDPSTRKSLEDLGLPKERIDEIVASGYSVESVLDVKLMGNTRK